MSQLIGIILHFIGGFSSASFYVPYNFVKKWSWQIYWVSLGFVAWMVMPWIGGFLTAPHLIDILRDSPLSSKNPDVYFWYFMGIWRTGGRSCIEVFRPFPRAIHITWCLCNCRNNCSCNHG